jgi:hypothetical protein
LTLKTTAVMYEESSSSRKLDRPSDLLLGRPGHMCLSKEMFSTVSQRETEDPSACQHRAVAVYQ